MDENFIDSVDFSEYNPYINEFSDINLPEINKNNSINKKYILKNNYRFTISLIIFIICTSGYIMNQNGLVNVTNPSKINKINENSENEFNVTKFLISNNTCQNKDLISRQKINKYFDTIYEFRLFKKINNYLIRTSFILSLSLVSIIYYINRCYINDKKENKCLKIISFNLGIILLFNELIIFIIYIDLFIRLYEIIFFIETNIENKCIILLTWDYTIKVLKQLIRIILIMNLFKICNLQLIIYLLKKLFVLNNYFNHEEKEQQSKDMNLDLINNEDENYK